MRQIASFCSAVAMICCAVFILVGQKSYGRESLLPVHSADLLKCLPPAEPGWTMTVSKAEHILNSYPLTKAERVYTRPIPDVSGLPNAPVSVEKLSVTIVDVANNRDLVENFNQRRESSGAISFGGIPGLRLAQTGEADHIEVLLFGRFIATIALTTPRIEKADQWIAKINFKALEALAQKKSYYSMDENSDFVAERVDELNPKRTKKFVWTIAPEGAPEPQ